MSRHFWRACNHRAGFSFVELLVTIVIAGIAFAAMVPMFVQAQKAGAGDRARMTALNVAQDRIEKIRQLDYDLITNENLSAEVNSDTWLYSAEFGPEWTTTSGRVYDVAYQVEELRDDDDKVLYKSVTVRVTWNPGGVDIDGTDAVTLRTFIYQQYAGPQIVDLFLVSPVGAAVDTSVTPYVINWVTAPGVQLAAVLNAADDNASVRYVSFAGYGGGSVPVVSENVSVRTGEPARFTVTWNPATDGSEDGLYRFEATAYSSVGGFAGNTFVEEFVLSTGPPPRPTGIQAMAGATAVTLWWASSPAGDVVKYEVWRSSDALPLLPAERVDEDLVTSAFFSDSDLTTGTTYTYYLVAVDDLGKQSADSEKISVTPEATGDTTAPPVPVVTPVPTPKKAVLTWPDVLDPAVGSDPTSGISYYVIEREDGVKYRAASPEVPLQTVTWAQDITAPHTYTVASVDKNLNQSAFSPEVSVSYVLPTHKLIVSSNKNCVFTVTDDQGNVMGQPSGQTMAYELTLPEGHYYVEATKGNVTEGPSPVMVDQDPEVFPAFSF
jgi:prepilin-type N-terminal cleavage/methylation domain-containing protein